MAFLPLAWVTGVISDRGTIGSGKTNHVVALSLTSHMPPHNSAECCCMGTRAVRAPLSSHVIQSGSCAVTTPASVSHSMKQPFDLSFITTAHCLRLPTTVTAWCECLLGALRQDTWPTNRPSDSMLVACRIMTCKYFRSCYISQEVKKVQKLK